jgi:signal transduction histidine kinase/DNA-binding response OmpR family regulator/ligand-binding sensor domain-containing protein
MRIRVNPPGVVSRMEKYSALIPPPNVQVSPFVADRRGFLWCGTNMGLARFDGYELKLYPPDRGDPAGSLRAWPYVVAADSQGFVWGGTLLGGVQRLDPVTGRSRWYGGSRQDSNAIGMGATKFLVTSDGELWAGVQQGLARYDRASDRFVGYPFPSDYPPPREGIMPADYSIAALAESGPSIWIGLAGSGGGLAEFNRKTGLWKRYLQRRSSAVGPSDSMVRAIYAEKGGGLWLGTRRNGLDRYDPQSGAWKHFSVSKQGVRPLKDQSSFVGSPAVWVIAGDDFGGIWLLVLGLGVLRYDPDSGQSVLYRHDSTDVNSIPSNALVKMAATSSWREEGGGSPPSEVGSTSIWLPPRNWGLSPLGQEGIYRGFVRKNLASSVLLPHRDGGVWHLVGDLAPESRENLWGVLYNGLLGRFNLRESTFTFHPDALMGIRRMIRLRDGTLLVSNGVFRAWRYDAQNERYEPFLPRLQMTRFLEGEDSLLWLGCRNARGITYIASLDRRTGVCTEYPRQDSGAAAYMDVAVQAMCDDRKGGLWYGTEAGGLVRFDLHERTYRRYTADPESPSALPANGVSAIVPEGDSRLWIGTDAGLALMECEQGTFERIPSHLSESREVLIRGMADDGEGHLWLAAYDGAFCLKKATREFRVVQPPPGILGTDLLSVRVDPKTRSVTFGGAGGLFTLSLDDVSAVPPPPPVVLTSFKVFEKPYPLEEEIWAARRITIPYSASFISFTFAALDYDSPAKNQYAYRLEGIDREWVYSGTRRYVSYSSLDPGTYTFRVRGASGEGIWNNEGTSVEIVVLPPWYRTAWAYAVYTLAFVGAIGLLVHFDRRRAALRHTLEMRSFEAAKMRELDQLKSDFFANISHEFRTPLTLILGPLEQFAERFKHDEHARSMLSAMRRSAHRLLELINQLLDLSRMDAGRMSVQVRPLDLVSLCRSIVLSFRVLAESKRVDLIYDPEEDQIIAYADRDKIEKIVTNLLSNAFKFTGEGGEVKAVLRFAPESPGVPGRRVEMVVSDTGVGIAPEDAGKVFDRFYQVRSSGEAQHGGTGLGLALTKELVGLLKGEITLRSSPGRGTSFVVRLPIGREAWSPEQVVAVELIPEVVSPGPRKEAAGGEEPSTETEAPREGGKPTVLIVEDNGDLRMYVRSFLESVFNVEEAENGQVGLEKAREEGIDLVISDIMMPVMDGMQLCKELKADERTNHIPVILLTARASADGKVGGLEAGADDYIIKPFDARELTARAKNLVATRRKLWEKYHRQLTLGPANIPVASADERFLKRLAEYLEQHVADAEYDTETLAHDMCMSRMQLNRKLNALTGQSTHGVVREYRLQRAAELLRKRADSVSGIAFGVGFSSLSHFARAFRERFGVVPSEYGGADGLTGVGGQGNRRN